MGGDSSVAEHVPELANSTSTSTSTSTSKTGGLEGFITPLDGTSQAQLSSSSSSAAAPAQQPMGGAASAPQRPPWLGTSADAIHATIHASRVSLTSLKDSVNRLAADVQDGSLQRLSQQLSRKQLPKKRPCSLFLGQVGHIGGAAIASRKRKKGGEKGSCCLVCRICGWLTNTLGSLKRGQSIPFQTPAAFRKSLTPPPPYPTHSQPHLKINAAMGCLARMPLPSLGIFSLPHVAHGPMRHARKHESTASLASLGSQLAETWDPYLK